jgi:hypothetical protein
VSFENRIEDKLKFLFYFILWLNYQLELNSVFFTEFSVTLDFFVSRSPIKIPVAWVPWQVVHARHTCNKEKTVAFENQRKKKKANKSARVSSFFSSSAMPKYARKLGLGAIVSCELRLLQPNPGVQNTIAGTFHGTRLEGLCVVGFERFQPRTAQEKVLLLLSHDNSKRTLSKYFATAQDGGFWGLGL